MAKIIYKHTLVWKFCLCEKYWPYLCGCSFFFFFLNIYGYVFEVQHFFIDFYVMTTSILNTTHQQIGKLQCVPTTTDDTSQRILWEVLKDRQEFKRKKKKPKHFITQGKCRKLQTNVINCLFSKDYNFSELNEEFN